MDCHTVAAASCACPCPGTTSEGFSIPCLWLPPVAAGSAPEDPAKALKLFKSFFYITHMQQVR